MQADPMTLMGLGIGAVVAIWLVFSVVRKMVGLAIVLALIAGAWFVYANPAVLAPILAQFRQVGG